MINTTRSIPPAHRRADSWKTFVARIIRALLVPALFFSLPAAQAHAFLEHASPEVGSTLQRAPEMVSLWFSEALEPAFSAITVVDQAGRRVDDGNAHIDSADGKLLHAVLKPLPPGTYHVHWHVVSVDSHATEGSFTFEVAGS